MFSRLLIHEANIVSPTTTGYDEYGNFETTQTTVASGVACRLVPKAGSEDTNQRETTTERATLFLDAGAPIDARSLVEIDGDTWKVTAPPMTCYDGVGAHHIEAELERVTL